MTTNKKKIWIDTDLSVGMKRHHRSGYCDVDDGFAVWQLMRSPSVHIAGISAVFGNTLIDNAYALSLEMSEQFAPYSIPVFKGFGEAIDLAKIERNEAIDALAEELKRGPMTIMAIGPATNIGVLLLQYPELKDQIQEVVLVAGRRSPTDYFSIGNQGNRARDLNFDLDNHAFQIMFQAGIPITLCPFEISNKVWITAEDLDLLKTGDPGCQYLEKHSRNWLAQWINQGAEGFNPFDVLASHYIIAPDDIISENLNARLEIHIDDTIVNNDKRSFKNYLLCDHQPGYAVKYCYDVVPEYHTNLMQTLL